MNAQTLKALKASIAHWRRMAIGKGRPYEEPAASQCPLCDLFLRRMSPCLGCPVRTEFSAHCEGTPYHEAYFAFAESGIWSSEFQSAAKLELEFLESLLPKKCK